MNSTYIIYFVFLFIGVFMTTHSKRTMPFGISLIAGSVIGMILTYNAVQ
jgi:uncharacterized membrane protein YqgA involved in biofilm formation